MDGRIMKTLAQDIKRGFVSCMLCGETVKSLTETYADKNGVHHLCNKKEEPTMKISVDADKLNQAFGIIAEVKNELTSYGDTRASRELQQALDILGPMYVGGLKEAETPVTFTEWNNSKNILKRIDKLEEHNASFPYIEPSIIADGFAQEYVNKKAIIDILAIITKLIEVNGVTSHDGYVTYFGEDKEKHKLIALLNDIYVIKTKLGIK
jgi:hypothetical protein